MRCLDESLLLPGDIILSTQDHFVSKAIRKATKSDISHAMLYVARGSVIDSTGEGVHARNTQRLFYGADCAIHVRRLVANLSDKQLDTVIRYARNQIGTRYSMNEAMRSAHVPRTR
jgi:permuted papain-like amidase YaeF/Yiix C92 family enzyme